ncbi:acyltransferase family protein [Collimonas pratensis]|uniref:Acyltransferase family protein n=1 Tax=Collimonas pratensis TaxID=279113 RepID=A0A127Q8E0_9BURK|nr:acyltransferase [Collimonas pratensis]AMP06350.1 acyltransferase family protein [Collimonas pratensis]
MTEINATRRIYGLDTLRASAILLVMMSHYGVVVSGKLTFGFLTSIGWMGVDLFFVLSGYLIGNQIMSTLARGNRFSLKTFFARRLLRTLPAYYVVLAIYFMFPSALGGSNTPSIWRFLTFTQNIGLHFGETFSHSWSLCIEEQFYLILPVVALLIASFRKPVFWGWSAIAGVIIAGMAVRGMAWMNHGQNLINPADHAVYVYYSSFARFDELLPGVAIAMLRNFHGDLYSQIIRKGNLLLVCGAASFILTAYLFLNYREIDDYGFTFSMMTFGYPLLAASFALLTMSALSPNSLLNRLRVPGAEKIALWSYAIYLVHKAIFKLSLAPLSGWNIDADGPVGVAIVMGISIFGGWLLYRLVETPFMQLRAKLFPSVHFERDAVSGRAGSMQSPA